mgnify:CR=1 FL=1
MLTSVILASLLGLISYLLFGEKIESWVSNRRKKVNPTKPSFEAISGLLSDSLCLILVSTGFTIETERIGNDYVVVRRGDGKLFKVSPNSLEFEKLDKYCKPPIRCVTTLRGFSSVAALIEALGEYEVGGKNARKGKAKEEVPGVQG